MHETPEDLTRLEALLERSFAAAGSHLRGIPTPEVYGAEWDDWVADAPCAPIDADRMYTFRA